MFQKLYFILVFYIVTAVIAKNLKKQDTPEERIVCDLESIEDANGVPLDFKYNETKDETCNLVSASGCPKSIDGYPWIYHFHQVSSYQVELRCHMLGMQGPCPRGQILYLQSGTMYGVCGCECLLGQLSNEIESNERNFNYEEEKEYENLDICYSRSFPQGQVYDKKDKTVCYNVGERGPCRSGTVLTVVTSPIGSKSVSCYAGFVSGSAGSAGSGFVANMPASECSENERYSEILRKCIKLNPAKELIIG